MNALSKTTLFVLFSGVMFAAQAADPRAGMAMHEQPATEQAQRINGKGVIKAIDMDSQKITIAHDAIPAVNWPPMTMRFTITPQTQLNNVKDGDSVAFTFVQQGNLSLLQDIRAN
jgi:Cu(I)/Ag(I) efflux system protein CusF